MQTQTKHEVALDGRPPPLKRKASLASSPPMTASRRALRSEADASEVSLPPAPGAPRTYADLATCSHARLVRRGQALCRSPACAHAPRDRSRALVSPFTGKRPGFYGEKAATIGGAAGGVVAWPRGGTEAPALALFERAVTSCRN